MNLVLNKKMHTLLAQANLMDEKRTLVQSFTEYRTEHSSEMTDAEAMLMIDYLRRQPDPAQKMRRKIISMAHEMGWHSLITGPSNQEEGGRAKWVIDMKRLNAWMVKYSYLHKELNAYRYKELPKLITQFESLYQSFLKKV